MKKVVNVQPVVGPSIMKLYKELEVCHVNERYPRDREAKSKNVGRNELENNDDKNYENLNSQLVSFQRATKCLIILGQTVGLMPVLGMLREPPSPLRFKILSYKMLYGLVMFISQTLVAMINVWIIFETNVSVTSVSHLSFYVSSAVTTIMFFQVAKKWPLLLRKLPHYQLDEYVDSRLKTKCNFFITIFLTVAIVEHVLAEFSGITAVLDCATDYTRLFRDYIEMSFPWVTEFGLPDHFLIGVAIKFINITATLTWSYSDIFIVCISYYLTSVLEGIYRKLIDNKTKYLSSSFWMSVREDYNHAANLVRAFDEVVSGAVFVSFTANLFFICFQLYNLLSLSAFACSDTASQRCVPGANALNLKKNSRRVRNMSPGVTINTDGVRHTTVALKCPRSGNGPLGGYESVIYLTYSMMFVLFRYLCVSLIAARVHTTAKSLAPVLYDVPSNVYNVEVQRFLDQVHHDTIALSGLKFFYITKSLVLTVAGTIFTYELVLLQYGG